MFSDAFFVGTTEHAVCQDYAIAEPGRAILADGCSTAPWSDWGARFLCQAARRSLPLPKFYGANELGQWLRHVVNLSRSMAAVAEVPLAALSATLCLCEAEAAAIDGIRAFLAGDGYVIARNVHRHDLEVIRVQFADEAPLYPIVHCDHDTWARYCAAGYGQATLSRRLLDVRGDVTDFGTESGFVSDFRYPFYELFLKRNYDVVVVASDGLASFTRLGADGNRVSVPDMDVIARLMNFKCLTGEFLQRRLRAELRRMHAEGWQHMDDVGVAGLAWGE